VDTCNDDILLTPPPHSPPPVLRARALPLNVSKTGAHGGGSVQLFEEVHLAAGTMPGWMTEAAKNEILAANGTRPPAAAARADSTLRKQSALAMPKDAVVEPRRRPYLQAGAISVHTRGCEVRTR
jgi:hypothetical protein